MSNKDKVLVSNSSSLKTRQKKYIITLENINTEKVDQKYGIIFSNIFSNVEDQTNSNTTKLSDLADVTENVEVVSFLDETKRTVKCNVSMIDFNTKREIKYSKYNCFWDRHPFDSDPLGCPIRYVSNKGVKKYFSEISKDNYIIKENITKKKFEKISCNNNLHSGIDVIKNEYFETDGIFCSFNCIKAFIKDNKHNCLYQHSEYLMYKLYNETFNTNKNIVINPAPHWRLLREYGGNLSIDKFRESFNKSCFVFKGNKQLFKPISFLYEEKINF
jgi:hypothetical protein